MEHELIPVYTKFTGNGVRVQNDSRRENGSGRLFETLIQYRLQGWVQPVY